MTSQKSNKAYPDNKGVGTDMKKKQLKNTMGISLGYTP